MSEPRAEAEPAVCEPGVCEESSLITTDSFEEFSHEINSLPAATDNGGATGIEANPAVPFDETPQNDTSNIEKIQDGLQQTEDPPPDGAMSKSSSFSSAKSRDFDASTTSLAEPEVPATTATVATEVESGDYLHDASFLNRKRHVFILSTAGKPIYSMHGNEDKLATLFGVMQALVSSIHAGGVKFVFLVKSPLILVAVSRTSHSVQQIQLQLT